jgi:hypothetical protein
LIQKKAFKLEIVSVLTIITTITSIITAITLIFTYRQNAQRDKPQFEIRSLNLGHPPDRKIRGIHIQNPSKAITHCQVFCNGIALETQFGIHMRNWVYISIGSSADFMLPEDLVDRENAIIAVKDGKRTLLKTKLKELPYVL